jgi:hypothetical protein
MESSKQNVKMGEKNNSMKWEGLSAVTTLFFNVYKRILVNSVSTRRLRNIDVVLYKRVSDPERRGLNLDQESDCPEGYFCLHVRFQVLTAASMKFRVLCDVAPYTHAEAGRRFRGA